VKPNRTIADHRRDGALAVAALSTLLAALVLTDRAAALARPAAVAAGVAGAVALELLFLRAPRVAAAWERPAVWAGGTLATLLGGAAALSVGGWVAVAALCWGLVAYLALLGAVVAGWGNPLAALARP
jgi:hypothetical protein